MRTLLLLAPLVLSGCCWDREMIYVYNEPHAVVANGAPTATQAPSLTLIHSDQTPATVDLRGPRTIVVRKYLGPPPRWWEPDDRPLPTTTRCPDGVLLVTEWVYGYPPVTP